MTLLNKETRIFITGTAGFIGFHLARLFLKEGFEVCGYDGLTDYYDVSLKKKRNELLAEYPLFKEVIGMLQDEASLMNAVDSFQPDIVIHLAAQAGVRYSLENPNAYIQSNVVGTMNILEASRRCEVSHLLMASTSSVYGANSSMPFREDQKTDMQLTIYAATKKANESMSHAYSHLWGIPTTLFRFFTVYGPWGRPDMALFKFVESILEGREIIIFNYGEMYRDFTYVSDLVYGIKLLCDAVPPSRKIENRIVDGDSLSPVAPWRVVNIGNSTKVRLLDFVDAIESQLGIEVRRNYMDMQPGDVPATWADASLLERLTGYRPNTDIQTGVANFIKWFRAYYNK